MTKIDLLLADQILTVVQQPMVASGDQNSVQIQVEFDSHWKDYTKSAVFFTASDPTVYEVDLTDNTCIIPWEVLATDGILYIGVRGVNTDHNKVKTSTLVSYKIVKGAPGGTGTTVDPTSDAYAKIIARLEALEKSGDNGSSQNPTNASICTFLDAYAAWCNGEQFPIAFLGDSTYQGVGTSGKDYAFPARLQALLREECGSAATVYNAGISGKDLEYGIEIFDTYFGEGGTYADAKMVGIGYGINDRVHVGSYEEYKSQVYTKTEALIQKCMARGIQPFLVTSQATAECGVGTAYDWCQLRDSNSINVCANGAKKELAEKYGIPLLDLNRATEDYLLHSLVPADTIIPDHLHFGDVGHEFEAGYLFSQLVSRVIPVAGGERTIVSYASQHLRHAVPEDKLRSGGDFKVFARYNKDGSGDEKILDAYVFVADSPATLTAYRCDGNNTYVKVDGEAGTLDSLETDLGVLDLGLHHLEVYTGESTWVNFRGFVLNAPVPCDTADSVLLDTMGEVGEDKPFSGMTESVVPVALMPDFDKTAKTTALSGKTVTAVYGAFIFTGDIHIGKVDLNAYGSGAFDMIDGKSYAVTSDRYHRIDIDPIELGEHETLAIGLPGDTARPYCCTDSSAVARITTADKFRSGADDVIGMKLRVYGKDVSGGGELTEEQIRQIAEVAAGMVEVPEGGGEVWETIVDYTVPEDCGSVVLSTDINGNKFRLKKAHALFVLHPIDGAESLAANVQPAYTFQAADTNPYTAAIYRFGFANVPRTAGKVTMASFTMIDTGNGVALVSYKHTGEINYSEGGYGALVTVTSGSEQVNQDSLEYKLREITACSVGGHAKCIGAGTRIKLMGVRA